jgi:Tfp pilus assembly protein PilN
MKMVKDYINLLPREDKKAADSGGTTKILLIIFVLAWGGVFGWQGKQAWDIKEHMTTIAWQKHALLQQLDAMYKELGITAPTGTDQQKSAIIYTLLGERVLWSEVFKQFSRTVPKGLWFDNLEGSTAGRAEIKIKGGAFNYLSVAEFMLAMEKSNYFERPQLLYAQKNVVQGQDVIGFEIICGIKKGGEVR